MHKTDKLLRKYKLKPIFFHGAGGSIARGGGDVEEQLAWWPTTAIRNFKATIQGEVVFRIFATPELLQRQIEKVAHQSLKKRAGSPPIKEIRQFAKLSSAHYKNILEEEDFLKVLEKATPYMKINTLNIGSRPSRRGSSIELSSLRAIPWVLCWVQNRLVLPAWWGLGSAWENLSPKEKLELIRIFKEVNYFTLWQSK